MSEKWESYEEVARYLLDRFAAEFGLDRVEGKQHVEGHRSGTKWEIDAKGVRDGINGFIIVECRRYTTAKQNQGKLGGLAYSIIDAGAEGGILVSPLGMQEGATKIANAENIVDIHLNENSTRYEYVLQFLKKIMIGVQDSLTLTDKATCQIVYKDGTLKIEEAK